MLHESILLPQYETAQLHSSWQLSNMYSASHWLIISGIPEMLIVFLM